MQGTSIEATLWGDFADKYHDMLQEGKVLFSELAAIPGWQFCIMSMPCSSAAPWPC